MPWGFKNTSEFAEFDTFNGTSAILLPMLACNVS